MSDYTIEIFTDDIKYFFETFTTIINQHFDENGKQIKEPSNSKVRLLLENKEEIIKINNDIESFNFEKAYNEYQESNNPILEFMNIFNVFNCKEYDWEFYMTCHYLSNDYSFLDDYSNEVSAFFIKHFKITTHPDSDFIQLNHFEELFDNIKTIRVFTDICKVYFENDFLDYKSNKEYTDDELRIINFNYQIKKQKEKRSFIINQMILENNIKTIKLIFKFKDIIKEYEISSLFLTDDYFNSKSFTNLNEYTFTFNYKLDNDVYENIISYFTKCEISQKINEETLNNLFVFSDMFQLNLSNILYYLSKINDSYNSDLNNVTHNFLIKLGNYEYYETLVENSNTKYFFVNINDKKYYIGNCLTIYENYCNICSTYPPEINKLKPNILWYPEQDNYIKRLNEYFYLINKEPISFIFS